MKSKSIIVQAIVCFIISCCLLLAAEEPKKDSHVYVELGNVKGLSFDLYLNGFLFLNELTLEFCNSKTINQYLKNDNNVLQLIINNYPYHEQNNEIKIFLKTSQKSLFVNNLIINNKDKKYLINIPVKFEGDYLWQKADYIKLLNDKDISEIKRISNLYANIMTDGTPDDIASFLSKHNSLSNELYAKTDNLPALDSKAYKFIAEVIYDFFGKGNGENRKKVYKSLPENITVEKSPFDERIIIAKEKNRQPMLDIRHGEDSKILGVLIESSYNFIYYNKAWQLY